MRTSLILRLSLGLSLWIFHSSSLAHASELIPYSTRPTQWNAQVSAAEIKKFERIYEATRVFVVQMRAMYLGRSIYILGRDGEPMFDLWRMLFPSDDVRLINVSRNLIKKAELSEYLDSVGLTVERPASEVILLDTGYEGSIIDAINQEQGRTSRSSVGPFSAHLISSVHPRIPSSRIALNPYLEEAFANQPEDDVFSEAGELFVEEIEGIRHWSKSARAFCRAGQVIDACVELNEGSAAREAIEFTAGLLAYGARPDRKEATRIEFEALRSIVSWLNQREALAPETVAEAHEQLTRLQLQSFWMDLREAMGKGVLEVLPSRWVELWAGLPGGKPKFIDIEEDQGLRQIRTKEKKISQDAKDGENSKSLRKSSRTLENSETGLSVVSVLETYLAFEEPEFLSRSEEALAALKARIWRGAPFELQGRSYQVGEKLGEGVRSDVYALDPALVIKVAYEAEDMAALVIETRLHEFIRSNPTYSDIRLLDIIESSADGAYMIKPAVERENFGHVILKSGRNKISREQKASLERLFAASLRLAQETGIALDLKPDNLAWVDGNFVVVDVGPRTFYQPYYFTLEAKTFDEFIRRWDRKRDSNGRTTLTVLDFIRQSQLSCTDALTGRIEKLLEKEAS